MNAEKVASIVNSYAEKLPQRSEPRRIDSSRKIDHFDTVDRRAVLQHIHYMLEQIPRFLKEGRREKAMRWLGFVQGVLWVLGFHSLESLMEHNKPENSKE